MTRAETGALATVLAVASLVGGGIPALEGQAIDSAVHSGIHAARPILRGGDPGSAGVPILRCGRGSPGRGPVRRGCAALRGPLPLHHDGPAGDGRLPPREVQAQVERVGSGLELGKLERHRAELGLDVG